MTQFSLGCMQELPDYRDFMIHEREETQRIFTGNMLFKGDAFLLGATDPVSVDQSKYCSPIENQGSLGSCTAQACVGLLEYMQRRSTGEHVDGSRLFVYKMARAIDGLKGDTGAYIRTAMKSLKIFGAPPERYWPYDVSKFEDEPTPFVYSFGQGFRVTSYYRFDKPGYDRETILKRLRTTITYGLPVVFGFVVYNFGNDKGEFVMPDSSSRVYGGHAILAVGYDNERKIGSSTGAFKIRNSWGTGWGEKGYGWLPYDYVLKGLSFDFWTVYGHIHAI